MTVKENQVDLVPLVSELIVKETGSFWFAQGIETILLAMVIIAVVFSILYLFIKKMPFKGLIDQTHMKSIEVLSTKKISRTSNVILIRWNETEYLIVENSQGASVIDKKEAESDSNV
jgi:hypothetical protein